MLGSRLPLSNLVLSLVAGWLVAVCHKEIKIFYISNLYVVYELQLFVLMVVARSTYCSIQRRPSQSSRLYPTAGASNHLGVDTLGSLRFGIVLNS